MWADYKTPVLCKVHGAFWHGIQALTPFSPFSYFSLASLFLLILWILMTSVLYHLFCAVHTDKIFPHIWGSHKSYMTLQLLHSEFHNEENLIFFFIIAVWLLLSCSAKQSNRGICTYCYFVFILIVLNLSPDILFFRVIHRIQYKNLFGKPDWCLKWFGTFDCPG